MQPMLTQYTTPVLMTAVVYLDDHPTLQRSEEHWMFSSESVCLCVGLFVCLCACQHDNTERVNTG